VLADHVEGVKIVEQIADELSFTWAQKGALFGYDIQTENEWLELSAKLIRSTIEELSQDVQDRVDLIIDIVIDNVYGILLPDEA
jgi:hypothetical protein